MLAVGKSKLLKPESKAGKNSFAKTHLRVLRWQRYVDTPMTTWCNIN